MPKPSLSDLYHLHRRAEFFVEHNDIAQADSIEQAVEIIFGRQQYQHLDYHLPRWNEKDLKAKGKKKQTLKKSWIGHVKEINRTWIRQMMHPRRGLVEKMTLFWHGHFACRTVMNPYQTLELNEILRENALGNFRDMLFAVSKSSAMIGYLHLRQNKKGHPNEDFARELCELFTLGRDVDYTEQDVVEIARAFTGWTTNTKGEFLVRPNLHDEGEKTIFGKTGNFGGEDVLDMILENKHCADHIARKVYRFFAQEDVNEDHVSDLSKALYNSGYDISIMMKYLFRADWFYESKGKIVKSPIELLVVLGRMFHIKYPEQDTLLGVERYLGHVLFDPPNVAGWPGGRQWIDASRLALRLRLGSLIINKGYIMDELSPELDEMITKNQKKKDLKFYEEVNWDKFWKRNEGADLFDLIIAGENEHLRNQIEEDGVKTIIQLLSTPDFQLT